LDSMPRLAKQMPRRLPLAPSHTAIITPAVSTCKNQSLKSIYCERLQLLSQIPRRIN